MRRHEQEITDQSELDKIIGRSRVCRLGLADNGQPYVVPLNFGYAYPYLYFHSAAQGRKLDILRQNPRVCFEFDHMEKLTKNARACDWGAVYTSIIGRGEAIFLTDDQAKRKGLEAIMAQYSGRSFTFPDEVLARTVVIQVKILGMTGKKSDD